MSAKINVIVFQNIMARTHGLINTYIEQTFPQVTASVVDTTAINHHASMYCYKLHLILP